MYFCILYLWHTFIPMWCQDIGNGPRADNCQKMVKTAKSGSNSGIPYPKHKVYWTLGTHKWYMYKDPPILFSSGFKVDQIQDRKQSETDVLNQVWASNLCQLCIFDKDSHLEFDALLKHVENNVGGLPYKSLWHFPKLRLILYCL